MISPDSFYEERIQNKSVPEILTCIHELNQEIDSLISQSEKEFSADDMDDYLFPQIDTRLMCMHEYLDKAREGLAAAAGSYELSSRERKDAAFQESIPFISSITVERSGWFLGMDRRSMRIFDGQALPSVQAYKNNPTALSLYLPDYASSAEEFFEQLSQIHIGEWKDHYDAPVLDGEQWKVSISYTDNREELIITGSNAYPPCFECLWSLFESEEISYKEVDDDLALGLALNVIRYLSSVPEGFISSTSRALNHVLSDNPKLAPSGITVSTDLDTDVLFSLDDYVKRMAANEDLYLDMTEHNRCVEGLPHNLSFVVKHLPK